MQNHSQWTSQTGDLVCSSCCGSQLIFNQHQFWKKNHSPLTLVLCKVIISLGSLPTLCNTDCGSCSSDLADVSFFIWINSQNCPISLTKFSSRSDAYFLCSYVNILCTDGCHIVQKSKCLPDVMVEFIYSFQLSSQSTTVIQNCPGLVSFTGMLAFISFCVCVRPLRAV